MRQRTRRTHPAHWRRLVGMVYILGIKFWCFRVVTKDVDCVVQSLFHSCSPHVGVLPKEDHRLVELPLLGRRAHHRWEHYVLMTVG